ncbi:MAG: type II/IV secretion system ATPase subunit [Nitrososphaerota archaeon]|nr:type II/IV secretion system ATPase subunit [Nitrososphaerota archaeon]
MNFHPITVLKLIIPFQGEERKRQGASSIKYVPDIIRNQTNLLEEEYMFTWENVPGNESKKLVHVLRDWFDVKFGVDDEEANTKKNDEDNLLLISDQKENSAEISLEAEKAVLKVNGENVRELAVKKNEAGLREIFYKDFLIDEYHVGLAKVSLIDRKGTGYYVINEPEMSLEEVRLYSTIEDAMRSSTPTDQMESDITQLVMNTVKRFGLEQQALPVLDKLLYYIKRDQEGYWVQDVLMKDEGVEEITFEGYAKGPVGVIHRNYSNYTIFDTNISFTDEDRPRDIVLQLAFKVGKSITSSNPLLEGMTRESHRVAATFGNEVSLPGTSWSIRKHLADPLTLAQLVKSKMLSPLMGAYLWIITEQKGFIEILGATGSGKTTLLSATAGLFPPTSKIVTIEDSVEIKLPHKHWEQLRTRMGYGADAEVLTVDMMDLTKYSLRIRPDLLVPGESRGEEIRFLFQAVASGHGALTSFHAESPQAALARMASPPLNVGQSNLQLIWCFVQVARIMLGSKRVRRTTMIEEPNALDITKPMNQVFSWDVSSDSFSPGNAEEVFNRSYRLNYTVPRQTGWTRDLILRELNERSDFLSENSNLKYTDFYNRVERFYVSRYGTI